MDVNKKPSKQTGLKTCLRIFYILEKLFVMLIRVNLCIFLRYIVGYSESRATLLFHIFQTTTYMSSYLFGQLAMYSLKPILILSPTSYLVTLIIMWSTILNEIEDSIYWSTYVLVTVFLLAVTHGLNLVGGLKVVELQLMNNSIRSMMLSSLVLEIVFMFNMPFMAQFMAQKSLKYLICLSMTLFLVTLMSFQLLIMFAYFKTTYSHYGPAVYLRMFFKWLCYCGSKGGKKKVKKGDEEEEEEEESEEEEEEEEVLKETFVDDIMHKLHYVYLFMTLPGIIIALEVRYSYWMFSVERLERVVVNATIPAQSVFAIQQLTMLLLIPIYSYLINPICKAIWRKNPLRKMGLGVLILLSAMFLALYLVYVQELHHIRPIEPYFDQSKVVIRNGLDCTLYLSNRLDQEAQQYKILKKHAIDTQSSISFGNKTKNNKFLTLHQFLEIENEELYSSLKINEEEDDVEEIKYGNFVYPVRAAPKTVDGTTYLIKVNQNVSNFRSIQFLTVIPWNCKYQTLYHLRFAGQEDDQRDSTNMTIILIEPTKVRQIVVPYTRKANPSPGIRFFFANITPVHTFKIERNFTEIYSFPYLKKLPEDFLGFNPGDGKNLRLIVNDNVIQMGEILEVRSLYDGVFVDRRGKISILKLYKYEASNSIPFSAGIGQYILITIGELLFGVFGYSFFLSQTPSKLEFHTMCDWHLMYAFANIMIIIVIKCGLAVTFFTQLATLTALSGIFTVFFFAVTSVYVYNFQKKV